MYSTYNCVMDLFRFQVMTAARKVIVAADNGSLWKEVVNAVIALAWDPSDEYRPLFYIIISLINIF